MLTSTFLYRGSAAVHEAVSGKKPTTTPEALAADVVSMYAPPHNASGVAMLFRNQPSTARLRLVGGHRQLRISVSNSAARGAAPGDTPQAMGHGGRGLSLVREQLATIDAQLLWQRQNDRVHAAILWPARRSAA